MAVDFYIYQHRRLTDGKVFYVGKGHKGRAWSKDRRNAHWRNVVAKHGYTVEILEDGLQAWYAYEREIEVIAQRVESGCRLTNLTSGGDGVVGYTWTDEHRAKTGSATRSLWQNPEYRDKVLHGVSLGQKRIWADPEYKAAMVAKMQAGIDMGAKSRRTSESNIKAWADPEARAKRVAGIKEARKNSPNKAVEDERLRSMWDDPERKKQLRESKRGHMKPVLCVDVGITFDAIKAATRWLVEQGFTSAAKANVRSACQGKMKTAYGYRWQFVEGGV